MIEIEPPLLRLVWQATRPGWGRSALSDISCTSLP